MERISFNEGYMMVHNKELCAGQHCSVHNPSDHHMKTWKQEWRNDRALMERICEHGVGHPDPDHIAYVRRSRGDAAAHFEAVHGCDGCCGVSHDS